MGALLKEALGMMTGIPVQASQRAPKRLKKFTAKTKSIPAAPTDSGPTDRLPMTMPMPLQYRAEVAPIPMVGAAKLVQVQKEATVNAPIPSASLAFLPPESSGSTTDEASPKLIESLPPVCAPIETNEW